MIYGADGREAEPELAKCSRPACGMKIRSGGVNAVMNGVTLPFHDQCLQVLLEEVAARSGQSVEDLVHGEPPERGPLGERSEHRPGLVD